MSNTSFTSSDGSGKSPRVPILTPEEVGENLHLDKKVVEWLKKEPVDDKDPLLVLDFKAAFVNYGDYETNKQTIYNALINGGGTQISANVFKFDDWPTLIAARNQMKNNIPWAFYNFNGAGLMVNNQFVPLNPQQTIQTTVITWFSEQTGKLTILPFEFFDF